MAEIPSALPAAAAQAVHRAREISRDDDANRAGEAQIADRTVKSIDESSTIVDTDDADSRVFADSEGLGSQGRQDQEEEDEADDSESDGPKASGVTKRPDGTFQIDLQA